MRKKIVLLALIGISCFCFANEIKGNNILLKYDMNINEIFDVLGEPLESKTIKEYVNQEYNEVMIKYKDLTLHYQLGDNCVSYIFSSNNSYVIEVDNTKLFCGETKSEIEKKLSDIEYNYSNKKTHVYSYYADHFIVVFLTFDENDILVSIQLQHE